jgi:hypothetical protein
MAGSSVTLNLPNRPAALGAIRALICGWVFLKTLASSFVAIGRLPVTIMHPPGIMEYLSWRFYDRLVTPNGMIALKCLMLVCFLAATVGLATKYSVVSSSVLFTLYQGVLRSFGHFNHDECVTIYCLFVLACTPCGDGFSLDALLRKSKPLPSFVYAYPILLMQMILAWAYCTSGILKLRISGLRYFDSDNLPTLAIQHSLDNLHDTHFTVAFWLPLIRPILPYVVAATVAWEILFPLVIVIPRLKWPFLAIGVMFHILTMLTMNIIFVSQLAMYVVFVDWCEGTEWLRQRQFFKIILGTVTYRFRRIRFST